MKKLLVIADRQGENQGAFAKAVDLAKKTGAAVHVAVFCYETAAVQASYQPEQGEPDLKVKLIQLNEQWWHQFIKDNRQGLDITHEIVWEKNIHDWLIDHSQTYNYDLMVKTGHRSETAFYTPTDWQLFRNASVPVYIVAKNTSEQAKNILVALDVLANSAEKQLLNKKLIEQAMKLSTQTGAALHCAYVIGMPTFFNNLKLIDHDDYVRKAKAEVHAKFSTIIQKDVIPADCIHVEQGEPWDVISGLAKKLDVECVVVGTMGRKGLAGKLVGNTAEKIIRVVETDLMVISPEV